MARDTVDRPDRPPTPEPPPRQEVDEQELTGAIGARYRALGGKTWGFPMEFVRHLPTGGSYIHFTKQETGRIRPAFGAIYSHASTGAWEITGTIYDAWVASGREKGVLGFPIDQPWPTGDTTGTFQNFQGGQIVWHATTGTVIVEQVFMGRYRHLGGSDWGYPTASGHARDGGRFAHFRRLTDGAEHSLYWSPSTNTAVEVTGAFRNRYAAMNWEWSYLGYPVAAEEPWATPGDNGGSRQQRFEGGRILWRDVDGATFVDPVELIGSVPGGSGFGGEARVKLHGDGTVEWFGEVTNSAYQDYDYRIYAVVQAPADGVQPPIALALSKTGEINMQVVGTNRNRWHERTVNAAVGPNYAQLAQATLQVHSQFAGGITSALDDILTTLGAWTFTAAVGPGGLGLIYAGLEMGALVTGGNFPSGPRIIAGTLWMHGPGGMLFGFAVDALTKIGQRRRDLTDAEIRLLDVVFAGAIDPREITLTDTAGKGGRPFAFPGAGPDPAFELNMAEHYRDAGEVDFEADNQDRHGAAKADADRNFPAKKLVHEAVHAWQFRYMTNAASYVLHGMFDEEYEPEGFDTPWSKQNIEQQARLVERWVQKYFRPEDEAADPNMGLMSAAALADPSFAYAIGNVRAGRV